MIIKIFNNMIFLYTAYIDIYSIFLILFLRITVPKKRMLLSSLLILSLCSTIYCPYPGENELGLPILFTIRKGTIEEQRLWLAQKDSWCRPEEKQYFASLACAAASCMGTHQCAVDGFIPPVSILPALVASSFACVSACMALDTKVSRDAYLEKIKTPTPAKMK